MNVQLSSSVCVAIRLRFEFTAVLPCGSCHQRRLFIHHPTNKSPAVSYIFNSGKLAFCRLQHRYARTKSSKMAFQLGEARRLILLWTILSTAEPEPKIPLISAFPKPLGRPATNLKEFVGLKPSSNSEPKIQSLPELAEELGNSAYELHKLVCLDFLTDPELSAPSSRQQVQQTSRWNFHLVFRLNQWGKGPAKELIASRRHAGRQES